MKVRKEDVKFALSFGRKYCNLNHESQFEDKKIVGPTVVLMVRPKTSDIWFKMLEDTLLCAIVASRVYLSNTATV